MVCRTRLRDGRERSRARPAWEDDSFSSLRPDGILLSDQYSPRVQCRVLGQGYLEGRPERPRLPEVGLQPLLHPREAGQGTGHEDVGDKLGLKRTSNSVFCYS